MTVVLSSTEQHGRHKEDFLTIVVSLVSALQSYCLRIGECDEPSFLAPLSTLFLFQSYYYYLMSNLNTYSKSNVQWCKHSLFSGICDCEWCVHTHTYIL